MNPPVIPIHAGNPGPMTGTGNWTYLLPGKVPTLIDAGVGAAGHLDAVARETGGSLAQVLVTHGHTDHAGGASALAARWSAARFLKVPWPDRDDRHAVAWEATGDGASLASGRLADAAASRRALALAWRTASDAARAASVQPMFASGNSPPPEGLGVGSLLP